MMYTVHIYLIYGDRSFYDMIRSRLSSIQIGDVGETVRYTVILGIYYLFFHKIFSYNFEKIIFSYNHEKIIFSHNCKIIWKNNLFEIIYEKNLSLIIWSILAIWYYFSPFYTHINIDTYTLLVYIYRI